MPWLRNKQQVKLLDYICILGTTLAPGTCLRTQNQDCNLLECHPQAGWKPINQCLSIGATIYHIHRSNHLPNWHVPLSACYCKPYRHDVCFVHCDIVVYHAQFETCSMIKSCQVSSADYLCSTKCKAKQQSLHIFIGTQ